MEDLDQDLDISIKREENIHQVRLSSKVAAALHWASRNRTGPMHCECQDDGSVIMAFQKPHDALMCRILFR